MEAHVATAPTTGPDSTASGTSQTQALDNLNKPNGVAAGNHEQNAAQASLATNGAGQTPSSEKVASSSEAIPSSATHKHAGDSIVAPDTATASSAVPDPLTLESVPSIGDEAAALKDTEDPHSVGGTSQPVSNSAPLSTEKAALPPTGLTPDAAANPTKAVDGKNNGALPAAETPATSTAMSTNGTTSGAGSKRKADDIETNDTAAASGSAGDAVDSQPSKKQKKGSLAGKVAAVVDKVKEKVTPKKKANKKERVPVGRTERKTRSQSTAAL